MCRCKIIFIVINGRPSLEHEFTKDCCRWFGLFSHRELTDFDTYVTVREEDGLPEECFLHAVKDLSRLDGYLTDCRQKYDAAFHLDIAVFTSRANDLGDFIDDSSYPEILSEHSISTCVLINRDPEEWLRDLDAPAYDPY